MGIFDQKISCRTRHDESYPKTPFLGTFVMAELVHGRWLLSAHHNFWRAFTIAYHALQPTAYARWMLIIPHLHANSPPILFIGASLSIASSSPSLSLSLSLLVVVVIVVVASWSCRRHRRRRCAAAAAYRRCRRIISSRIVLNPHYSSTPFTLCHL